MWPLPFENGEWREKFKKKLNRFLKELHTLLAQTKLRDWGGQVMCCKRIRIKNIRGIISTNPSGQQRFGRSKLRWIEAVESAGL